MALPYYQDDLLTLFHGDSREILPQLPKADLCLTDPPYGIGIARKQAGLRKGKNPWMILGDWDNARIDRELLDLCLASSQYQIIWGANHYADQLRPSSAWLVWHKRPGMRPIAFGDAELAWTSLKGPVRVLAHTWTGFMTSGEKRLPHPTQKPVAVMKWCISQVKGSVETIIDPFGGSCSTLVAARELGIKAVAIEQDERYCAMAVERLRAQ